MFDHVTIRVRDVEASRRFYGTVLERIGFAPATVGEEFTEWGDFSIAASDAEHPPASGLHIGFAASSRNLVDEFWRAGTEAGYPDDGEPGERPQYAPGYYGAFLLDPDSNSAEAVHLGDSERAGQIVHLWIGVGDLGEAAGFYRTLGAHLGLRPGRELEHRVQFRGEGGTFSLVADGREATTGLHVAFRVPSRAAVEDFHVAAVAAGYRDNGAPGERPRYHPGYYGAFVLAPDGTNVEAVHHGR